MAQSSVSNADILHAIEAQTAAINEWKENIDRMVQDHQEKIYGNGQEGIMTRLRMVTGELMAHRYIGILLGSSLIAIGFWLIEQHMVK